MRKILVAAGGFGLTVVLSAQQQAPVFRGGVSLVPLDVRVVDNSGNPVKDLKQRDFTIKEDGVVQAIRHFSSWSFKADSAEILAAPKLRGSTGPAGADAPAPPPNRRVFLMVLARGYHQIASNYVDSLSNFITGRILPQDHVAIMAWNRTTDFTTNHALLGDLLTRYRDKHKEIEHELQLWFSGLRAIYGSKEIPPHIQKMIDDVFGRDTSLRPRPISPAEAVDNARIAEQSRRMGDAIQRNSEIANKLRDGFSTLPDVGAQIAAELTDVSLEEYHAQLTQSMSDVGNLYAGIGYLRHLEGEKHLVMITERGIYLPDQQSNTSLARIASDARIAFDIIQTGGVLQPHAPVFLDTGGIKTFNLPTTNEMFAETFKIQDLRLMADITGGQLQPFRTGSDAFRRLDAANAFQYLLAYAPARSELDGKFRKISVTVNRPGVRVMMRQGYYAVDRPVILDRRELATSTRISAAAAYTQLIDHIKLTLAKPTISGQQLSIAITIDVTHVGFSIQGDRHHAEVDLAVFVGDMRGTPVGSLQSRAELNLTEASYQRALKDGQTITLTVPITGLAATVKVVGYDYAADLVGTNSIKVR
jgi:VWFA-related protein